MHFTIKLHKRVPFRNRLRGTRFVAQGTKTSHPSLEHDQNPHTVKRYMRNEYYFLQTA